MISRKQSKFIKSLKIKKFRELESAFIVEGGKNVDELLHSSFTINMIVCTDSYLTHSNLSKRSDYELIICSVEELKQLGTFTANRECIAVASKKDHDIRQLKLNDYLFLLDDIRDPGNLGTIIRTLDWFGFKQVICSNETADFYNPKVINASMGSFTRISPFYTELSTFIRKHDMPVFGADMNGRLLADIQFKQPAMIVMGSESHGISEEISYLISKKISIPGYGGAESLNVGVATGIICHHVRMADL